MGGGGGGVSKDGSFTLTVRHCKMLLPSPSNGKQQASSWAAGCGWVFFLTAQKTQQKNQVEVGLKGSGMTGAVQNELPAGRKSFVRQKEPGP